MRQIILASGSPRRKMLLEKLGLTFISAPADIEEKFISEENVEDAVKRIAVEKAWAVSREFSEGLLIAADTIVVHKDKILGKPFNEEEAIVQLSLLSGDWHEVITALCLMDISNKNCEVQAEHTRVCFRNLSQEEIKAYVKTGEPMDKAGSYGIQGRGSLFVNRIEGCYFNVVGLPLSTLYTMLKALGVNLLEV